MTTKKLTVRNVKTLTVFTDLILYINRACVHTADHNKDAIATKAAELFAALTADGEQAEADQGELRRLQHAIDVGGIEHDRLRENANQLRQIDVTETVHQILNAHGWTGKDLGEDFIIADGVAMVGGSTIKSAQLIITP